MDAHALRHIEAADGAVGPTHDWQARCACGWTGRGWPSSQAAAHEHSAHRHAAVLWPQSA